jgi:excisionase family DNA binding protein
MKAVIPIAERLGFRLAEVAALTGVPKSTLHDAVRSGKIKAARIGRVVVISKAELDRVLAGRS